MTIKSFFLFLLLFPALLFGKKQEHPNVTFSLFEDSSAALNLSDVHQLHLNNKFKKLLHPSFNPGYTESIYWLAVEPKTLPNEKIWLLAIDNPHINILEWYHLDDKGKAELIYQLGDFLPFKKRPFPEFTNFSIPLKLTTGYYLLKVNKRKESLQVPVRVLSYDELSTAYINGNLVNGILSGAVIMMIFFSLALWIGTSKKLYLFYALYIAALLLWIWSNKGLGFEYIWPNSSFFPSRARPIMLLLNIVFSIQFMQLFIGQTKNSYLFYPNKALQVIAIVFLALILIPRDYQKSFISFRYAQNLLTIVASLQIVLILSSCLEKIYQNIKEAAFYLAAILALAVAGLLEQLYMYGTIILNYYVAQFALLGGLVVEASILLYGLAQKFNQYRKERMNLLMEKSEQQKKLTDTIVEVQEKERKIFADRLHDEIGSMLSVVALHLNTLKKNEITTSLDNQSKLEQADGMLVQIADTVRSMSHQISPVTIEKLGFVKALESLILSINKTEKLYIEFVCLGFEESSSYANNFLNSIYRIIQELLQNMIKHSEATNGIVQLIEHEEQIVIMAEDNGLGLTKERLENPNGSGMSSIFSKVDYLQGKIEIEIPGEGTLINIELPNQKL